MTSRASRLAAVLAGIALVILPLTARAQPADAQGWWSEFHQSGQPAPPAPPDVAADDLLLQGGDPGRLLPAEAQSPSPSALGALRFFVPPGAEVGSLMLQVAAGAQAADVRAYPTTVVWVPAQGGAIQDAPAPDFSRYSGGRLSADGVTVTFPDIGRLVTEQGLLSVVLLPGPADRLVVHKPLPSALTVTLPTTTAVPTPASYQPPVQEQPPLAVSVPEGPAILMPPSATSAPTVAPVVAPTTTQVVVAARPIAGRSAVPDDNSTRLVVIAEALLVVVFFGLLGQGPLAVLARLTGAPEELVAERGVGRFAAVREGRAPRL